MGRLGPGWPKFEPLIFLGFVFLPLKERRMRVRLILVLSILDMLWPLSSFWCQKIPDIARHRMKALWMSTSKVSIVDEELLVSLNRISPSPSTIKSLIDGSTLNNLEEGLVLQRSKETRALELAWGKDARCAGKEAPFSIDFNSKDMQRRLKHHYSELVVKAIGKPGVILDFTAGLGRDASLCAAAGTPVILFERNWVIFQLLKDALIRLSESNRDLAQRMSVFHLDSGTRPLEEMESRILEWGIPNQSSRSVYIDPMYPPDKVGRKSAVKKQAQILHRVVGQSTGKGEDTLNESAMLMRALEIATDRVVVKRPIKSSSITLEGCKSSKPSTSVIGSTHRFDIYSVPQSRV